MEEMIYSFFLSHGWVLTLIALSGIPFLGILKVSGVFKKVDSAKRKYLYAPISTLFAVLASCIYLCAIDKFAWSTFALLSIGIYAVNQTAYSFYENYGIRALFQKIGDSIVSVFVKTEAKKNEELVDDLANKQEKK